MNESTERSEKTSKLNAFIRWFDSWSGGVAHEAPEQDYHVDWLRVVPFLILHLACFAVIWVGWSWFAVGVCLALYFLRMFAITGFYHRYFSHRSFKTTRTWQFMMALWGATAVQRGPLWWAAHHRHHHRHSDEESDVHSPHQHSFLWSHMLWITNKTNFKTQIHEVRDLAKYPELAFLDRFDTVVPILFATLLFVIGWLLGVFAPGLGTNGFQLLVWGFFISTVLLFHGTCTINSLSHIFGTKRYPTRDESKNNFILSLITLGEGWHNNHHYYPAATRQGFFWWEIDITYYGLKGMSMLGLIWDLKPVPQKVLEGRK